MISIDEGKVSKGGVNSSPPSTPRPPPPIGQGKVNSEDIK